MARGVDLDPLHVFRFHAQWGEARHDLSICGASFKSFGKHTGRGCLTLRRALYGNDDALLKFLKNDKEQRVLLHLYHITSGYNETKRCWTDPHITIEFFGLKPSDGKMNDLSLDAMSSDVLVAEVSFNYQGLRFHQSNSEELSQTFVDESWTI